MENINITTNEILKKYNISRQTLYNWEKSGLISKPERDRRGWRIWSPKVLSEIDFLRRVKDVENINTCIKLEKSELQINNRRYLGGKNKLVPFIKDVINYECDKFNVFSDIFGGTGIVGNTFNNENNKIIINDLLYSNYAAYITWLSNKPYDKNKIRLIIEKFNNVEVNEENYFSINFGGNYFTKENACKIGYIRDKIEVMSSDLTEREKCILITSLIYAADKVANTCGHYDAYRKKLDTTQKLALQIPNIIDKNNDLNEVYNEDANDLVRRIKSDITYIDTPYNSRQYADAYHLLENLAKWEKPKVVGVAKKMEDRANIKSKYCTVKAPNAFENLIDNIDSKYILVSYSNMAQKGVGRSNAKISNEEIVDILAKRGEVKVFDTDYKVFTTGKTEIDDHKELLYFCKSR